LKGKITTPYIEGQDNDSLQSLAINQLNTDLENPGSDLAKNIIKLNITGIYLFDLTVQKKGQIVTIFAESDDKTDIPKQNALKDYRYPKTKCSKGFVVEI